MTTSPHVTFNFIHLFILGALYQQCHSQGGLWYDATIVCTSVEQFLYRNHRKNTLLCWQHLLLNTYIYRDSGYWQSVSRVPMPPGNSWIFCKNFQDLQHPRKWNLLGCRLSTQWCGHRCENNDVGTPLVFVVRFSSLHVTVMNIAVWMLLSHSYM